MFLYKWNMADRGKWQIEVLSPHLIVSIVEGSADVNSMRAYSQQFKTKARLLQSPWLHICDARTFGLAVPEPEPIGLELSEWTVTKGRTLEFFWVNNSVQHHQINRMTTDTDNLAPQVIQVNSIEDALHYIQESSFDIETNQIKSWFNQTSFRQWKMG